MLPRDLVARAACVVLAAILGCARSMPPPGGPLDTTPPRVMAVTPADSSVGVSRSGGVEFLFSEAMDRASVRDNVKVYPPPGLPSYQWHGRRFRLEWGESLGANATYQVFLSGRARDLRGVPMGAPAQVRFSTGAALAPGRIDGVLRAKTLGVNGVRILVFADSTHGLPDTTRALEPLYETETDTIGAYAFVGLPLAESFSVHAFYDRNADEFLDPEQDVLATHAGSVRLTPDRTVADSINIVAVNPRAPATLTGSIASPDSSARFVIEARAASDSSVVGRTERTGPGTFALRVVAGSYRLVARRTSPAPRGARPGKPAAAPVTIPEAVARLEAVITAAPEEELGPYVLSFPPAFAPPPPESQEESR